MLQNEEKEHSNTKGIRMLENGNYEIASLVFKVNQWSLFHSDGREIKLNYQEAVLLKMALEEEDYFINKEKAINKLWPESMKKESTKAYYSRFTMSISRLNKALSEDKRIYLSRRPKKGYYLIVEPESKIFHEL